MGPSKYYYYKEGPSNYYYYLYSKDMRRCSIDLMPWLSTNLVFYLHFFSFFVISVQLKWERSLSTSSVREIRVPIVPSQVPFYKIKV
ncbi:RNA-directed RNA polymerase [Dirofilaria immitis]